MSRLAPGLIELNKGLNLNTAKIAAPEGTLLDSLNYEQVDFQGQKRIDGYARYDGGLGSFIDDFLRVEGAALTIGTVVYVDANGELGNDGLLFGIAVGTSDIAVINETLINRLVSPYEWGREIVSLTADEHYELILQYNAVLRERATSLPGPVAGLHWFRDRLYAVAAVPVVEGSGFPNETWNGYPILKTENGRLYLGTSDNISTSGSDMASFFVSRSESQAKDELGDATLHGWEFKHLGWEVFFEDGISPYGGLVALNQNRQNIGVQGPSSTDGDNGRPLLLLQDIETSNTTAQVRGWKTSTVSNIYSLDVGALRDVDEIYIYADAHFSWNGDTGEVVANTQTLVEYNAGNTIEVEV